MFFEFEHCTICSYRLQAQFGDAILQPGTSPPRRLIFRLELVEDVGHVAPPENNPAEIPIETMKNILGGTFTSTGGRYEDVYVKTAAGWRFKSRQFVPSKMAVPGASAQATPPVK